MAKYRGWGWSACTHQKSLNWNYKWVRNCWGELNRLVVGVANFASSELNYLLAINNSVQVSLIFSQARIYKNKSSDENSCKFWIFGFTILHATPYTHAGCMLYMCMEDDNYEIYNFPFLFWIRKELVATKTFYLLILCLILLSFLLYFCRIVHGSYFS